MNASESTLFKRIMAKALRPLVKLLIQHTVSHNELSEMLKQAYVDVAFSDFKLPKKKNTVSRVAVLTGLNRKEVLRLSQKETDTAEHQIKITPNRAVRVITGWLNDTDFLTPTGKPRILPAKGEHSFATLVERYSGDITSGAILDELVHNNIVSIASSGELTLKRQGYIPSQDRIKQTDILLTCTKDLLDTGVFNINHSHKEEPRFQRQLTHIEVPETVKRDFAQLSQEKSMKLLLELDDWLKQQPTATPEEAGNTTSRVGLGIYYFEESDHEDKGY